MFFATRDEARRIALNVESELVKRPQY